MRFIHSFLPFSLALLFVACAGTKTTEQPDTHLSDADAATGDLDLTENGDDPYPDSDEEGINEEQIETDLPDDQGPVESENDGDLLPIDDLIDEDSVDHGTDQSDTITLDEETVDDVVETGDDGGEEPDTADNLPVDDGLPTPDEDATDTTTDEDQPMVDQPLIDEEPVDVDVIIPDLPDLDIDMLLCTPLETVDCPYGGSPNTKGIGLCKAATKTCAGDGMSWSECAGEVLPVMEICGNGEDDNCNDDTDENEDLDGDGWGSCSGDCCDSILWCAFPEQVNPGAFEVMEDGVDNDCNGQTDEDPRANCVSAAKFSGTTATDLLYGMDICQASADGSWGIVGTPTITRASETGAADNKQVAVMAQFGTHASNAAIYGGTMAVISSGRARDRNDPDPTTENTYEYAADAPPADFTAPYLGDLPTTKEGCPAGSGANDGVMLSVQLKVPTNAHGFSFLFRFFSQEYWQFTCNAYNDFFIAMLYTGASGIPADRNISFDGNGSYISVNSDQFFSVCRPKTGYACPDGTAPLTGTGFDQEDFEDGYGYFYTGGATKWLATSAPVIPGETVTLKFVVWDTSDRKLDSLVLIDNFKWDAQSSTPHDGDPGLNDNDTIPDSDTAIDPDNDPDSDLDTDIVTDSDADSDSGGDADADADVDTGGPSTYECWDTNKNGVCDIETEDLSGDKLCTERDCG